MLINETWGDLFTFRGPKSSMIAKAGWAPKSVSHSKELGLSVCCGRDVTRLKSSFFVEDLSLVYVIMFIQVKLVESQGHRLQPAFQPLSFSVMSAELLFTPRLMQFKWGWTCTVWG